MYTTIIFIFSLLGSLTSSHTERVETVYCIHGFMRSPSCMKKMTRRFEREGYRVNNWGYPNKEKFIHEHAEALVLDLIETAHCSPNQPIHFVTHSLGGLIVRSALNHPNCPEEAKVGRAVLLAPPNQGASFGNFLKRFKPVRKILGDRVGKQLLFCESFDFLGEFPNSKEVLVISGTLGGNPTIKGPDDGKVGVFESCLNTAHQHKTYPTSHTFIMYSNCVIEMALEFIHESQEHE